MFDMIAELIADRIGCGKEEITEESRFDELGIDSLDTVELIMAFEEAFGGAIPEEESRDLTTVGAVIDYLKAKGYGEKKPG